MKLALEQSISLIVNLIIHSGLIGIMMNIFMNIHLF